MKPNDVNSYAVALRMLEAKTAEAESEQQYESAVLAAGLGPRRQFVGPVFSGAKIEAALWGARVAELAGNRPKWFGFEGEIDESDSADQQGQDDTP